MTLTMTGIKNMTNPTSEQILQTLQASVPSRHRTDPGTISGGFAEKAIRAVSRWKAILTAFAKFLIATNQGIKAGNPNAKVLIEGGPWKLNATSTGWVQRYIQDTKRINPTVQFDGAAAHHYRDCPENPDLDSDIAVFLAMLDNNGYGNLPFYINEGGNYLSFQYSGGRHVAVCLQFSKFVVYGAIILSLRKSGEDLCGL